MLFLSCYLLLIASFTAMAAVIPGLFLVLRGMALMADAISHAILPGVVLMFLLIHRLDSPWLLGGASLAGLVVVLVMQAIITSKCLKKEVTIGLVFPFFFSIGVILICQYARDVHLDADMVLLGDIIFTPFSMLVVNDIVLGPYALFLMACLVLCNILFVVLFYKELVSATFDEEYAQLQQLKPQLTYYMLMLLTSITCVAAFDVVGSIVIVALMIVPAATALLLANRLEHVMLIALGLGVMAGMGGYLFAYVADVSIAGSIALIIGLLFALAFVFAPHNGLCAYLTRWRTESKNSAAKALALFLAHRRLQRASIGSIAAELGWPPAYAQAIVQWAVKQGSVRISNNLVLKI
jgi:manganese/zinc/iron transport system permease protein